MGAPAHTQAHLDAISHYLSGVDKRELEIVSGTARGADKLGEAWALSHNIPLKLFSPQWEALGKSAGYLRNIEMAEYATHLIAFWDGQSKGTRHMIGLARKHGLKVRIVKYEAH